MSVRVKIRIENVSRGLSIEASAIVNSGFESESPQIIIPTKVAEVLGLLPEIPKECIITTYETAGGLSIPLYFFPNAVKIKVITEDRESEAITCSVAISNGETQVILSDDASEKLGIELIAIKTGLWRFRGEQKIRPSSPTQLWH